MSHDPQSTVKTKRNPYNHADRVPDQPARNGCYCAAHGCPLMGAMSTHTTGGSEWWCFLHFGRDAGRLQGITLEINRREWLAKAITDLRMNYGRDTWADVCKSARHEFAMQQRTDLRDTSGESGRAWIARLEQQLKAMVSPTPPNPARQARIQSEGFQHVQFDVPETM